MNWLKTLFKDNPGNFTFIEEFCRSFYHFLNWNLGQIEEYNIKYSKLHILRRIKKKNLMRGNSEALESFLQTNTKKNLNLKKKKALRVTKYHFHNQKLKEKKLNLSI